VMSKEFPVGVIKDIPASASKEEGNAS
jgi:hypothetical protein